MQSVQIKVHESFEQSDNIKVKADINVTKAHLVDDHNSRNEVYDDWADKYDEELSFEQYRAPHYVAEYFTKHLDGKLDSRIIDVAAGTGNMARYMRAWGYQNCDALDPSKGMLEIARKKDLYVNYYCALLGENKDIPDDTYDGLCMAGAFGPAHIPCNVVPEMIRLVKPGGIICFGIRTEFLTKVDEYRDRLVPMFRELEAAGYWRLLEEIKVPDWFLEYPGIVWVYEVTCSGEPSLTLKSLGSQTS